MENKENIQMPEINEVEVASANEVKAEENISGSSLSVYFKTYAPHYRMRFSMLNLQYNEGLLSSPAPLVGWLDKWMSILYNVNRI